MYSREIDGRTLTLSASGWTYESTFILWDYESGSIWYHLNGENALTCIGGYYLDRRLEELGSTLTRWNEWVGLHPQSVFLKKGDGP